MTTEKQKLLINYLCQKDPAIVDLFIEVLGETFMDGIKQGMKIETQTTLMNAIKKGP